MEMQVTDAGGGEGNRFTGQVKLHSILLRTSDSDSAPRTLKVIINRDDVDFGVAEETDGTQTFELSRTSEVQELAVVCFLPLSYSCSAFSDTAPYLFRRLLAACPPELHRWWYDSNPTNVIVAAPGALQRGPSANALLPGQLWRRRRGRHANLVCWLQGRVDAAGPGADKHHLRGGGEAKRSHGQGDEHQPDGQRDWGPGAGYVRHQQEKEEVNRLM